MLILHCPEEWGPILYQAEEVKWETNSSDEGNCYAQQRKCFIYKDMPEMYYANI